MPEPDVAQGPIEEPELPSLLALAVQKFEEEGSDGLEDFLRQHPVEAAEVRNRLRLLGGVGMLAQGTHERAADAVPERLGEFRLRERLGSGGMGVVYLARQESLGRDVALKLIRPELLYFPQARERFRREIEAVAQLQHPGIVRVYSAGEEAGLPYFTMERIDGASLDRLLAALRDLPADRLGEHHVRAALGGDSAAPPGIQGRTWVEICCRWARDLAEALDYAHRRGVLHRDVKPSNVMVTRSGNAMLLDFGLASTRERGQITGTGSRLGSLPYLSPEQVRGERAQVDERADVYALGVTLYELLTLANPFHAADSSDEDVLRRILQSEVAPVRKKNRAVSWDVETVCMCAMSPEPERRYQHAADLARDLQNVLDGRPIAARRPPVTMRVRRFARRHPALGVSLAFAFLLVVAGPTVLAAREYGLRVEVTKAKEEAVLEVAVKDETLNFLNGDLLAAVAPEQVGKDATMRQVLDVAARKIEGRFPDRPLVEAAIRGTLGDTYRRLGLLDLAEKHLLLEVQLYRQHSGQGSRRTMDAERRLAALYRAQGRAIEAEQLERKVYLTLRDTVGPEAPATLYAANNLGMSLNRLGRFDEAEQLLREVVEIRLRLLGESNEATVVSMGNLGLICYSQGKYDAAEPWFRRALDLVQRAKGPEHPETMVQLNNLANLLQRNGREQEAVTILEQVLPVSRRVRGEGHPETVTILLNMVRALTSLGRLAEARTRLDETLAAAAGLPDTHHLRIRAQCHRAELLRRDGRLDDAGALLDEVLCSIPPAAGSFGSQSTFAALGRARIDEDLGRHEAAEALLARTIVEYTGSESALLASVRTRRAHCLAAMGRFDEAESELVLAHAFLSAHASRSGELGEALDEFIGLYAAWKRPDAEALWRQRQRQWQEGRAVR